MWGYLGIQKRNAKLSENGCGKFSSIDRESLDYIKSLGVSHVWYTGILRHATASDECGCTPSSSDWVKGLAGSPYSITDYYDTNPYLADNPTERMSEFDQLVKRSHDAGLKVIIDFVPNHVARDYTSFAMANKQSNVISHLGQNDDSSVHWKSENDFLYYPGEQLVLPINNQTYSECPAKASGNTYTHAPSVNDWYDTVKINYCDYHTATWDKMLDIILFWAKRGVDGFRCDMVELVPAEFFNWLISRVKEEYPDIIFVAEVYQKNLYAKYIREVGFDLLYDKSGMYDSIRAIVEKNVNDDATPVEAWQSCKMLTWNWQYLGDLQPHMLNFLENHDEQRFASDFFGRDGANCYAALCASLFFNRSSFMIYAGEEIGEKGMDNEGFSGVDGRTSIFDWWQPESLQKLYRYIHGEASLDENECEILERYRSLLNLASESPAMHKGSTYDLCYCNYDSHGFNVDRHFAFLRDCGDETYLVFCNFSNSTCNVNLRIPEHAFAWLEMEETEQFNHNQPIEIKVDPMNGCILRLCPMA